MRIQNLFDPGSGMKKFGSGRNIPDTQHRFHDSRNYDTPGSGTGTSRDYRADGLYCGLDDLSGSREKEFNLYKRRQKKNHVLKSWIFSLEGRRVFLAFGSRSWSKFFFIFYKIK
jgi:hypothetical protein